MAIFRRRYAIFGFLLANAVSPLPNAPPGFAVDTRSGNFSIEVAVDDGKLLRLIMAPFEEAAHVANRFFVRTLGIEKFNHDMLESYDALVRQLCDAEDLARTAADWSIAAFWRGTGSIYVVWPSLYYSGGPACLHSLHNVANEAGFRSYFHSLNQRYANSYSVGIDNIMTELMFTSRDIVIVPEVWGGLLGEALLRPLRSTGTRIYVYALAAASSGQGGDAPVAGFGMDGGAFARGVGSGLALGHYIRSYFDMITDPQLTLEAPMEGIFYERGSIYRERHERRRLEARKEDLVVLDNDWGLGTSKAVMAAVRRGLSALRIQVVEPENLDGAELAALYARAKVVLDLYLPGPERLQQEAALFNAWPVLASVDNGCAVDDKPLGFGAKEGARELPHLNIRHGFPFRVDPLNASMVVAAVAMIMRWHSPEGGGAGTEIGTDAHEADLDASRALAAAFRSFRRKVEGMPAAMVKNVGRVLRGSRLEFRLSVLSPEAELDFGPTLLSILYNFPLASVQLTVLSKSSFLRRWHPVLVELERRGLTDCQEGGRSYHAVRVRGVPTLVAEQAREMTVEESLATWPVLHGPLVLHVPVSSLPLLFTRNAARFIEDTVLRRMLDGRCGRLGVLVESGESGGRVNELQVLVATLNSTHLPRKVSSQWPISEEHGRATHRLATSPSTPPRKSSTMTGCPSLPSQAVEGRNASVLATPSEGIWAPRLSGRATADVAWAVCIMCDSSGAWVTLERWFRLISSTMQSSGSSRQNSACEQACAIFKNAGLPRV